MIEPDGVLDGDHGETVAVWFGVGHGQSDYPDPIKATQPFRPLFVEALRHREPRRGSRWHLDEVCTTVDGVRHWLVLVRTARLGTLDRWRAVDEYGFVLDILLQRHRDTEAAKTFLTRLLGECDVQEVIHTDQLRSYGAAIREIPSLTNVDHQQVISTARCNNVNSFMPLQTNMLRKKPPVGCVVLTDVTVG